MDEKKINQIIRNTKPKTYTESEVFEIIEEFFRIHWTDFAHVKTKKYIDKAKQKLQGRFMTPKGFRESINKAGLRGLSFSGDKK